MDVPVLIATVAISSIVSGVVGSLVALLKTKGHKAVDNSKAMQDGMRLLLMDKTRYLTDCAMAEGEITIHQRSFILQMVDTAHALGANGEMTACAAEVSKLPTKRAD